MPFGGFLDAATELLETVRITPGEYVPPSPEPSEAPTEDEPEPAETPTPAQGTDTSA